MNNGNDKIIMLRGIYPSETIELIDKAYRDLNIRKLIIEDIIDSIFLRLNGRIEKTEIRHEIEMSYRNGQTYYTNIPVFECRQLITEQIAISETKYQNELTMELIEKKSDIESKVCNILKNKLKKQDIYEGYVEKLKQKPNSNTKVMGQLKE